MIAYISILILILSVVYFFYSIGKKGIGINSLILIIKNGIRYTLSNNDSDSEKRGILKLKGLILNVSLILFIFMFMTSFLPTSFTGEHLTGLFLIIHVTLAPLFSLSLAALILFFSYQLKLNSGDYQNISQIQNKMKSDNRESVISYIKILFWLLTFISIPLLLSIILSLYPITGTDLQNFYLIVHRVSALIFSLVVLGLAYFLLTLSKL